MADTLLRYFRRRRCRYFTSPLRYATIAYAAMPPPPITLIFFIFMISLIHYFADIAIICRHLRFRDTLIIFAMMR
jgi:hypothetical protein